MILALINQTDTSWLNNKHLTVSWEQRCWTGKGEANVFPLNPPTPHHRNTELTGSSSSLSALLSLFGYFTSHPCRSGHQNNLRGPFLLTGRVCWNSNSCFKLINACSNVVLSAPFNSDEVWRHPTQAHHDVSELRPGSVQTHEVSHFACCLLLFNCQSRSVRTL